MLANFAAPAPVNFGRARREKRVFVRGAAANLLKLTVPEGQGRQAARVKILHRYSRYPRAEAAQVGV